MTKEMMQRLQWAARQGADLSPADPVAVFALGWIERLRTALNMAGDLLINQRRPTLQQEMQIIEALGGDSGPPPKPTHEPRADLLAIAERIRDSAYAAGQCNACTRFDEELRLLREVATAVGEISKAAQQPRVDPASWARDECLCDVGREGTPNIRVDCPVHGNVEIERLRLALRRVREQCEANGDRHGMNICSVALLPTLTKAGE